MDKLSYEQRVYLVWNYFDVLEVLKYEETDENMARLIALQRTIPSGILSMIRNRSEDCDIAGLVELCVQSWGEVEGTN